MGSETLLIIGVIALIGILSSSSKWNFSCPMDYPYDRVTGRWGDNRDYRGSIDNPHPKHEGIDFPAKDGSEVKAVKGGVVRLVKNEPESIRGLWISIEHPGGIFSNYVHLKKVIVKEGQRVGRRQVIALSGHSGNRAGEEFKPHMHFTLRVSKETLPEYERKFGKPKGGWGSYGWGGYAVPAEPVIPARYV